MTYLFVGNKIDRPEIEMQTVDEWKSDLEKTLESPDPLERSAVYMVTVPRLYKSSSAPDTFFYNTHYFVLQVIPGDQHSVKFKIFAGFARHYRMIDYLKEWDINSDIPSNHRLKMNRTTYAVEQFGMDRMFDHFLPRLGEMMDEINTLVWTRKANDIHAELFFADKFKDMIILQQRGGKKPEHKNIKGYTMKSLVPEQTATEHEDSKKATPTVEASIEKDGNIQDHSNWKQIPNSADGESVIFATNNLTEATDTQHKDTSINHKEPEKAPHDEEKKSNTMSPEDGFYVPLSPPSSGKYVLTIRKYHYTDDMCSSNAKIIRRTIYGDRLQFYKPALPFKMRQENYGAYKERSTITSESH